MRHLALLGVAVFVAGSAFAVIANGQGDPILERQMLMKNNAQQATIVGAMIKGESPFDATAAAAAMNQIADNMVKLPTFFPAGSDQGDTRALPAIWTNMADFEAHAAKLATDAKAAATAAAGGKDAFTAAFGAVGQDCGGCHQLYRKST